MQNFSSCHLAFFFFDFVPFGGIGTSGSGAAAVLAAFGASEEEESLTSVGAPELEELPAAPP